MTLTVSDIANKINGEVIGDAHISINDVATIEDARENTITFLASEKYLKFLDETKASVVIVSRTFQTGGKKQTFIKVSDPYHSFLSVVSFFRATEKEIVKGIHPTAIIPQSSTIGKNVSVGPYVVFGERCQVGDNVTFLSNNYIGNDVTIGENSFIYPNVTIREQTEIGKRVIIHSGTVIGSDGFGFIPASNGAFQKIPQVGKVVIEDDVEIGANCAIDRATFGETRIKCGVKLDNLIHVAHNVVIGEHTVIAAQTGISGSTKLGKECMIGGQVGFAGHIEIAERTSIAAQSGVTKSVSNSGTILSGYPAKEHSVAKRVEAALRQLPETLREFEKIKERVLDLEDKAFIK
ncbi:MAG: UDP-3-O-(3-hydroxymyristoyl)glucosamine N-acyltransferase, partial [Ignavibacteriales bacterium]|nr:UDP-3-O-(3-hydroxymyristoyl)glucosamine N-acyltransferase [Ignavibacteriales bacterium]